MKMLSAPAAAPPLQPPAAALKLMSDESAVTGKLPVPANLPIPTDLPGPGGLPMPGLLAVGGGR